MKLKMLAVIGLAAALLAGMTVRAQNDFRILPLGLGTITNTVIFTNQYSSSGTWATNYVTNSIITPNYSPGSAGVTQYVQMGATLPLLAGAPGYYLNNTLAGQPNFKMANGWVRIPPNVDLTMAVMMYQTNSTTNGTATFGFDLSDDAVLGTTNTPLMQAIAVTGVGTNEYFVILNRTNFQGACYFRWDWFSASLGMDLLVVSNKFDWRGSDIQF
jgi:hypothetical protein